VSERTVTDDLDKEMRSVEICLFHVWNSLSSKWQLVELMERYHHEFIRTGARPAGQGESTMSNYSSKFQSVSRLFLGVVFFVFGLNGFLGFAPMPPMPAEAQGFLGALAATGYMFPLIKGTEVLVGIALLANRFVPLALTVLAPISINILLFHTLLAPALGLPLAIVGAQLYLAWSYRMAYRGVLSATSETSSPGRAESYPHGAAVMP
jgi:uncharacterized membrane protein YphA (DoxX/SURF4 family)